MNKLAITISVLILSIFSLSSQIQNPITWSSDIVMTSQYEGKVVFNVTIEPGWHLYGFNLPEGGPKSTQIIFDEINGVEYIGDLKASKAPIEKFDEMFNLTLSWWDSDLTIEQTFIFTDKVSHIISGKIEFQGCNDQSCIAPQKEIFSLNVDSVETNNIIVAEEKKSDNGNKTTSTWWNPVKVLSTESADQPSTNSPWWMIFIYGFLGGLAALVTPCVWPLVPMTVSFFLKRSKDDKKKGIRDAWLYGASIVVIYVILGLAVTLIFGASALNALSTNAIFNILFFLMLVVFAASFFGAFEITLPSSWSNAVDSKAEQTTGFLSIFLMAFTLTLVSFSCTGPIIGFLLVEVSTSGNIIGPAIGMLGFAIALALPFTLFAMFPSWLKSMPKSGNWMNVIKVTLGFLELAFALKFLSVADLAYGWHILDRETFLSLWIMIFALLGFYLLGKIKFPHDEEEDDKVGVTRFFLALISLAFAVYMVPGLWGAPLRAISAFAPPATTQDFVLNKNEMQTHFLDYEEGMAYAKKAGKPVLLDFTGHGCVNCRKMENAVWIDQNVKQIIDNDYVLISLYVDEKAALPEHITVTENGKERTLRTIGDKWSYLQRVKFGANAQPFYVLVDNEGMPLNSPYSYDEDVNKYIDFLKTGLKNYKK